MWLAKAFQFHALQQNIDILLYSFLRICFDSNHELRRSVSVDLCEFFNTWFQDGWFFIHCPLLRILFKLFFPFKGLLHWLIVEVCLWEEKLLFICDIGGRGCHLDGCCLDIFPEFETYLLRDFKFKSGEKFSSSLDWTSNVCFFEVKLQHMITYHMHSRVLAGSPLFGKSGWRTCCPSEQLLALLLPTECVQTREMPFILPKILLSLWTF